MGKKRKIRQTIRFIGEEQVLIKRDKKYRLRIFFKGKLKAVLKLGEYKTALQNRDISKVTIPTKNTLSDNIRIIKHDKKIVSKVKVDKDKKISVTFVKELDKPTFIDGKMRINKTKKDKITLKELFAKKNIIRFRCRLIYRKGKKLIKVSAYSQYNQLSGSMGFRKRLFQETRDESILTAVALLIRQLKNTRDYLNPEEHEDTLISFLRRNKRFINIRTELQIMRFRL